MFKTHKESEQDSNKHKNKGDDWSSKYKEAFKSGSSIAGIITSKWNSQEKPGKVYVANRRIHHGGIGSVMKLSKYFKKSEPTVTGVVSGIGEGLAKDDYADRKDWFKFKKKKEEDLTSTSSTSTSPTFANSNSKSKSHDSQETSNIKSQGEDSIDKDKAANNAPI